MTDRTRVERRAGRMYFVAGLLAGAMAVGAYTASCDSMGTATSASGGAAADQVLYSNGRSGLTATTVQGALDEIGTTMRAATTTTTTGVVAPGNAPGPTVW